MTKKAIHSIEATEQSHWVGDGFPVRTLFSIARHDPDRISPFLMLDHGGPLEFPPSPQKRGVGEHPHRGFETVTIVYSGELEHRDSAGHSGKISAGDVQWMTAASGVVHEEMHSLEFSRRGGQMEMAQLWVNLPAAEKMSKPRYQEITKDKIPNLDLQGAKLRVIAGEFQGERGPARTVTPLNVWDLRIESDSNLELEIADGMNALVVILAGAVKVQDEKILHENQIALLNRQGAQISLQAQASSKVLLLSGTPIEEPVAAHGPFVMNTREEIYQAIHDYQSGKMGTLSVT